MNKMDTTWLKNICDNCDKVHCHGCKKTDICLGGGLCIDCYVREEKERREFREKRKIR